MLSFLNLWNQIFFHLVSFVWSVLGSGIFSFVHLWNQNFFHSIRFVWSVLGYGISSFLNLWNWECFTWLVLKLRIFCLISFPNSGVQWVSLYCDWLSITVWLFWESSVPFIQQLMTLLRVVCSVHPAVNDFCFQSESMKQAEVAAYFRRFEDAEKCYLDMDRR